MTVVLLQLLLPLALLAGIGRFPPDGKAGFWIQGIATAITLFAIALAGLWVALPWWLSNIYPIALGVCAVLGGQRSPWTPGIRGLAGWAHAVAFVALGAFSASVLTGALAGRLAPEGEAVDLEFPLANGTYLVANGGSHLVVNSNLRLADPKEPRRARFRGAAYGVDLVALDGLGLTAQGFAPADPKAHHVYGREVKAPCGGEVVHAEDGHADRPVGQPDRDSYAGNHVILRCGRVDVVLAHLATGSVVASRGDKVAAGATVGRVGNSGASDAPHLHVHAQRPGSALSAMSGDPVPMRFGGRFLVRNDRVGGD